VWGDSYESGSLRGGVEDIAPEVSVSEDAALRRREDELSRGTPGHQLDQVVDEECGNRYIAHSPTVTRERLGSIHSPRDFDTSTPASQRSASLFRVKCLERSRSSGPR
jgi:hypothetical protein